MAQEKAQSAEDRNNLISQMKSLVEHFGERQEKRLDTKTDSLRKEITDSTSSFQKQQTNFEQKMNAWAVKNKTVDGEISSAREKIKSKIKSDWSVSSINSSNGLWTALISYRLQTSKIMQYKKRLTRYTRRLSKSSMRR